MSEINETINMSFRVNKKLKKDADKLFKELGLNTSVALNMFLTQSVREQGIPFVSSIEIPNSRLIAAIKETDSIEKGEIKEKEYNSVDELFKDLD